MKRKKTPGRSATGIANDVFGLGKVFVSDWKVVANRTWIDREYLEDAFAKADALMKRVGVAHPRARSIDDDADPVVLRSRLSALLVGDLDRIRQAVTYVRWEEGDADAIVPSLYARTRTRRARADEGAEATTPAPVEVATLPPAGVAPVSEAPEPEANDDVTPATPSVA